MFISLAAALRHTHQLIRRMNYSRHEVKIPLQHAECSTSVRVVLFTVILLLHFNILI